MDKEKHQQFLNKQKFERIAFAYDYIVKMRELQGEIKNEDFISCLSSLYDKAFNDGKYDVLDRSIATMFSEIDEIEEKMNQ